VVQGASLSRKRSGVRIPSGLQHPVEILPPWETTNLVGWSRVAVGLLRFG
jgi:hypothetical protein